MSGARERIENVEVDHLWLGDNGQNYSFKDWGPYGPGVLGSAGKIDHFSFHDLTIETKFLCGVNTNSETTGFSIHDVTVLSGGDHGFYLAGTARIATSTTTASSAPPPRCGRASPSKRKATSGSRTTKLPMWSSRAIGIEGDHPTHISRDVLIADNWIHDITAWHTEAITLFNAEDVIVRNNRITDTAWIAISLRTHIYTVSNVLIKDNIITRAAKRDPAFAIAVYYDAPPKHPAGTPSPGSISGITIEGNQITDCAHGIAVVRVDGQNVIRNNRVENHERRELSVGYNIAPLATAMVEMTNNIGVNCGKYVVPKTVTGRREIEFK